MNTFITFVHIFTCIGLVAIVLLQHGRGADIGATFGGGASQTVFGSRGAGNFLTKLTTGAAVTYMLTSLSLSYVSTQDVTVFDSQEIEDSIPAESDGEDLSDLLEEIDTETDAAGLDVSADELVEFDPDAESPE